MLYIQCNLCSENKGWYLLFIYICVYMYTKIYNLNKCIITINIISKGVNGNKCKNKFVSKCLF